MSFLISFSVFFSQYRKIHVCGNLQICLIEISLKSLEHDVLMQCKYQYTRWSSEDGKSLQSTTGRDVTSHCRQPWKCIKYYRSSKLSSLSLISKNLQEKGEDVHNVQIDTECGKDVLLRAYTVALFSHQELCVKCQKLERKWEHHVEFETHILVLCCIRFSYIQNLTMLNSIAPSPANTVCIQGTCMVNSFKIASEIALQLRNESWIIPGGCINGYLENGYLHGQKEE